MQRQQHDIGEQTLRNDGAAYERGADKDALQEVVHRAQLTTKGPYQGLQGNGNWTYRSQRFSSDRLHEGLYCGRKGKGYATEVVTIEKLLLDGFEG